MLRTVQKRLLEGLRWSQTYTKTDMVYLASGGFWLVLGQAISSLAALTLAVAFANLIPPETYGTYKYILSLAGLFALFSLPGMNTAFVYATAQGKESTMYAVTRSRVLHASIGSIFAFIGSAYYFFNGNTQLSLALLVIAAALPLFDTFTSYLSYLIGKRRFDLRTKYHAFTQILSTLTLLTTILFTDNLIIILAAYFIPLASIRAILHYHIARTIPHISSEEEKEEVKGYGKHLTIMQILGTVASEVDKILIWKFLGPVQVAVYTFALAIPEQIKGPLKGVGELAFPKFAAQTPEQIKENLPALWRKIALYAFGLLGISLIYILVAPYIFAFLFPQYMESVSYSQWFALSIVASAASVPAALLTAQKETKTQYIISSVQPIITIGLLVLLIPLYGIMGAISALIMSRFISLAMYLTSLHTIK